MNRTLWIYLLFLAATGFSKEMRPKDQTIQSAQKYKPVGWSFDLGGQYTWMSLSTPPTYDGSTGGVVGKITYEKPDEFFGQLRTVYNLGPLSSSQNRSDFSEWYTEAVGGYTFRVKHHWTITPYAGLGLDFFRSHQTSYDTFDSITLHYNDYYAVAGLETRYTWNDWLFGLQGDCLPSFNQFLRVSTLSDAKWTLKNRVGAAVRLSGAYRFTRNYWLELTPYYRYLPIGSSSALDLPERNLNQVGAFLTFRFFL